jgi:hypothetical protein
MADKDVKKVIEYDNGKMRSLIQLGEFKSEKDLLNFALALTRWYLTTKSEGWDVVAKKGDHVKPVQLRGI